jgi:hypothetical protein
MGVDVAEFRAALGAVKHAMTMVEPRHYEQATAFIERDPHAFRELIDSSIANASMVRWAATRAPNGTADVLNGALKIANSNPVSRFGMRRLAGSLDTIKSSRLLPLPRQARDVMGATATTVRMSQKDPELVASVLKFYGQHVTDMRDSAVAFEQLAPDLEDFLRTGRENPEASKFAMTALKAALDVS